MIPTLHEFAGIVMLALVTSALLVLPSAGQPHGNTLKSDRVEMLISAFSVDGIETLPPLSARVR